ETLIRAPLFERSRRGMQATPIGHELLRYVRSSMSSLHACARTMDEMLAGHELQLRVGGVQAATPTVFAPAFAQLARRRPQARVSLVELTNHELMRGLSAGEFDLVLAREQAPLPESLACEAPYHDEAVLVVAPGHALARRKRLCFADLRGQRWIMPAASFPMGKLFHSWLETSEIGPVEA